MSMTQSVESAILAQTRRALRTLLAVPLFHATGLVPFLVYTTISGRVAAYSTSALPKGAALTF